MLAKTFRKTFAALGLTSTSTPATVKAAGALKVHLGDLDLECPADAFEALRRISAVARCGEMPVTIRRGHVPPHQRHLKTDIDVALAVYAIH